MWEIGTQSVLIAVAVLAVMAFLSMRRLRRPGPVVTSPVLIGEAMRRRGITPADAAAAGMETEVLRARERCVRCQDDLSCRIGMARSDESDVPAACPNREFFAEVEAHKHAQPAPRPVRFVPPG